MKYQRCATAPMEAQGDSHSTSAALALRYSAERDLCNGKYSPINRQGYIHFFSSSF